MKKIEEASRQFLDMEKKKKEIVHAGITLLIYLSIQPSSHPSVFLQMQRTVTVYLNTIMLLLFFACCFVFWLFMLHLCEVVL